MILAKAKKGATALRSDEIIANLLGSVEYMFQIMENQLSTQPFTGKALLIEFFHKLQEYHTMTHVEQVVPNDLRLEFWGLLESDHGLRKLEIAATYLQALQSCVQRLKEFESLSRERPLANEELAAMRTVQAAVGKVQSVFEEAVESARNAAQS